MNDTVLAMERNTTMTFEYALEDWKAKAIAAANARLEHDIAYAKAIATSAAKNAEGRKAEADLATTEQRREAELLEIEAKAAYHLVLFLRGSDLAKEAA